ncbi:MAG TPA: TonB-dependent receptor, partial [Pseudomonas sp.]|nr:TonB-dependent receptor [Pseudomonas sp.]
MKLTRLALAVALLPSVSVHAQTPDYYDALQLSDTIVSANRLPQLRTETAAATTVFTRADIDRLQAHTVAELLERVPGVSVVRTGGAGSLTSVFIRGTASGQTLFLIDGQRIAAASSGTSSIEFLNPDHIERVEVVRGARSALYGSDAIGGVVHIFTRQGNDTGLAPRLRFGVGSHSTFERSLAVSGGDDQTQVNLAASLNETAGIDATRHGDNLNRDDDAYRNRALSFNLSHRFNEHLEAGFSALDQRGQIEYDDVFGPSQPTTDFQLSTLSSFATLKVSDGWKSRFELGHSEDKRDTGNDL